MLTSLSCTGIKPKGPLRTGSKSKDLLSPEQGATNGGDSALPMDEFLVREHEEAQELSAQPFGASLLHHVGMIYTLRCVPLCSK